MSSLGAQGLTSVHGLTVWSWRPCIIWVCSVQLSWACPSVRCLPFIQLTVSPSFCSRVPWKDQFTTTSMLQSHLLKAFLNTLSLPLFFGRHEVRAFVHAKCILWSQCFWTGSLLYRINLYFLVLTWLTFTIDIIHTTCTVHRPTCQSNFFWPIPNNIRFPQNNLGNSNLKPINSTKNSAMLMMEIPRKKPKLPPKFENICDTDVDFVSVVCAYRMAS